MTPWLSYSFSQRFSLPAISILYFSLKLSAVLRSFNTYYVVSRLKIPGLIIKFENFIAKYVPKRNSTKYLNFNTREYTSNFEVRFEVYKL